MKLWLVRQGNKVVIVSAFGRENAKYKAQTWIGRNADEYVVTPLTNPEDVVAVNITLQV